MVPRKALDCSMHPEGFLLRQVGRPPVKNAVSMRNLWVSALVAGAMVAAAYWGGSRTPEEAQETPLPPAPALPQAWAPATPAPAVPQMEPTASQVTIRLPRLFATTVSNGKNQALLGRDGEQRLLAEGDSWTDFTLMRVEADRVLLALEGGGTRWIERSQGQVFYATSSATPVAVTPTPEPVRELDSRELEKMWQRSAREPIGKMVPEGLRLTDAEALVKGLHLEKGDVLTAINGQPVRSVDDLRSLSGECTLSVLHEGQPREVRLRLR